ncbi:MAG: Uma2 family endonuclease [Tepidisphaeraceae bacterium]
MSIISTTKMTSKQFLELGEDPPGVRLELVDGEVAVSPSPIPAHGYVVVQLMTRLALHAKQHDLGRIYPDIDTIFGEHDVRRPDILYFSKARLHLIGKKAMEGPPDLCVEVISPSSGTIDRRDKFKQYAAGGVAFYWIVDPKRKTLEAFALENGEYKDVGKGGGEDVVTAPPVPDLSIPLGDVWQPE